MPADTSGKYLVERECLYVMGNINGYRIKIIYWVLEGEVQKNLLLNELPERLEDKLGRGSLSGVSSSVMLVP